jgi:hypothetical protein
VVVIGLGNVLDFNERHGCITRAVSLRQA